MASEGKVTKPIVTTLIALSCMTLARIGVSMIGTKPHFVYNQRYGQNECILVAQSSTRAYTFTRCRQDYITKDGVKTSYFGCYQCRKTNNRSASGLPIVKVNSNSRVFLSDPRVNHICGDALPINELRGKQMRRELQAQILDHGIKPTAALISLNSRMVLKYGSPTNRVTLEIKAAMGSHPTMMKSFQRARLAKYPKVADITNIPLHLSQTLGSNPHSYVIGQSNTMLVFSSPSNLKLLIESEFIVMDGTFKYAPKNIDQIYRVFGIRNGNWFPVVTGLLCGRSEMSYKQFWQSIVTSLTAMFNGQLPNWSSAHLDCELAAANAFKCYFPRVPIKMCLLHIRSNLYSRIKSDGLSSLYRNNVTVNRIMRRLGAIPLLPISEMESALSILRDFVPRNDVEKGFPAGTVDKINVIITYFRNTWIRGSLGSDFIDHFSNKDGPRTSNAAESYHAKQKSIFSRHHPRLGEWLSQFQANHCLEEDTAEDLARGRVAPKKRDPTYVRNDAEIDLRKAELNIFLLNQYTASEYNTKITEYLSRISYLIGFKGVQL